MKTDMQFSLKMLLIAVIAVFLVWGSVRFLSTKKDHESFHIDYSSYKLEKIYDKDNIIPVAVLGSGPAGYSAALYGARSGFYTVVFEGPKPGGQLMGTSYVENWPGLPKKMGPDLIKYLREQSQEFGVVVVNEGVTALDVSQWPYELTTENGTKIHALTVILATGSSARLLDVPGAKEYFGWDKGISTCAICDAPFYKGKDVLVVGGGDSAAEEAMQLAPYARKITLLVRAATMRASAVMQDRLKTYKNIEVKYNTHITTIKGDGKHITDIEISENGTPATIKADGIFLAIGHDPNSGLVKGVVDMDAAGFIKLKGRTQATSVPAIYAAGDVDDHKYRQAGIASGEGIKAGLDAVEFLRMVGFNDAIADKVQDRLFDVEGGPGRLALAEIATKADFDKVMSAYDEPIFLDFYTETCPTCMQMLPTIETLASEFADRMKFFKIDLMKMLELQEKYAIAAVPTFLILKKGELVGRAQKTMTLQEMKAFLETALGKK